MCTRRLRTGCRTDWWGSVRVEMGWWAGEQVWQWRTRWWSLAWALLSCRMAMSNCRIELVSGRRELLGCRMEEFEKIFDRLGCRMEL